MKKIHYAWVVCAAGTLTMICVMGFCCSLLSAYLPYIVASGLSASAGSAIVGISSTATLLAISVISRYYSRFSLRTGITLALLLGAVSMVLFSVGGSAVVYFVAAFAAGTALGLGGSVPQSLLIGAWFRGRRGTALGIVSAGSGVATIFFPVLIDRLVSFVGLRGMFLCAAAFILVAALVVWRLIRSAPEEMGLAPYGEVVAAVVEKPSAANALAPAGWVVLMVLMVIQGGYSPAPSHLAVIMTDSGYAPDRAAFLLSLYGIFVTAGKFFFGTMVDWVGAKRTTLFAYCVAVAGCLGVLFMDGQQLWPCVATALLLGVGVPPNTVGIALLATDISSPATYTNTVKWMEISSYVGCIVMGFMPGILRDAFGSYRGGYMLMALWAALSIPLLFLLYRVRRSTGKENLSYQ